MAPRTRSKITSKGQVTLPKVVRDKLGVRPGDEIDFVQENGNIQVVKVVTGSPFDKWVGYLEELRGCDPDELLDEARGRDDSY